MSFAKNIKSLREAHGYTQAELTAIYPAASEPERALP